MNCSGCGNVLGVRYINGGAFYLCRECRGIWLEMEQLVRVAQDAKHLDLPRSVDENWEYSHAPARSVSNCPQCRQPLEPFEYAYDSGIMIYRCKPCRGVWLGANEVFQIARCLEQVRKKPLENVSRAKGIHNSFIGLFDLSDYAEMGIGYAFELVLSLVMELFD